MTPEVAAITRLLDVAPLTALVGQRVYNQHLPQTPTLPCVLVFRATGPFTEQLLRGPDGISNARVQVEARALTEQSAAGIASAFHGDGLGQNASGLFGWIGTVGGSPSFAITNVKAVGGGHGYYSDELRQYWNRRDYMLFFRGVA